jgi:DNA-binding NarL/FixJ family response regulator
VGTLTIPGSIDAPRITLLLIDDHAMLREGLRALLDLEPDLEVIGEAGTYEEAVLSAAQLRPKVVLVDIGLPGRSGLDLVCELHAHQSDIRVVLLTAHASEEYIRAGLDVGADGYVSKDSSHAELVTAIHAVAEGRQYLCKAVASRVLADYLGRDDVHGPKRPSGRITAREREVLARIAAGRSNKGVARELDLSVKTVEKHRANLMRKLALHNAAGITRYALQHQLISADNGLPSAWSEAAGSL